MALIVLQQTIADQYPVDPAITELVAGTIVGLNTLGQATNNPSYVSTTTIGIAGDTISSTTGGSVYSADLLISPGGAQRWTSNRVSDFFNETVASGYITVYIGSGKFVTDQFDNSSFVPGTKLYSTTGTIAGENWGPTPETINYPGLFTSTSNGRLVGYVAASPSLYPSGVPGTDVQGSTSLPGNSITGSAWAGEYLTVILDIGN